MFSDKPDRPIRPKSNDLYEGFNDLNNAQSRIISTVAKATNKAGIVNNGSRPPSSGPLSTQMRAPQGTVSRQSTGNSGSGTQLSSVRGAGYSSNTGTKNNTNMNNSTVSKRFDPFGNNNTLNAPPLEKKTQETQEGQARNQEEDIHLLLEETIALLQSNKSTDALSKSRECMKKERQLVQLREKQGTDDQINTDLTFAVGLNMAQAQHACGMYDDAKRSYSTLLQDTSQTLACRVRINLGMIYLEQKQYKEAIKQWKICVDEMSANEGFDNQVYKIQKNIANAQQKHGEFAQATETLHILAEDELRRDAQVVYNLLICQYALNDVYEMKRVFELLLDLCDLRDVALVSAVPPNPFAGVTEQTTVLTQAQKEYMSKYDGLFAYNRAQQKQNHVYVQTAARLIAPCICDSLTEGYDWVLDCLRNYQTVNEAGESTSYHSLHNNVYSAVTLEVEMCKGLAFQKRQDLAGAYEVFQQMEKREDGQTDLISTNLAFLYWLEGDYAKSEHKADIAVRTDRYNARALVNKANVLLIRGDHLNARELYLEAVGVEADCSEAIYNLGICNIRMGYLEDALQAFRKAHRQNPKDSQVIFQLASVSDMLGQGEDTIKYLQTLIGAVDKDASVFVSLGSAMCRYVNEAEAVSYYRLSYSLNCTNIDVISWLGVWYVKQQQYHEALSYFARACDIAPHDIKWRLMVAACHRRLGDSENALQQYIRIHEQDPTSIECLRYLVALGQDGKHSMLETWSIKLAEAERISMHEAMKNRGALEENVSENNNFYGTIYEGNNAQVNNRRYQQQQEEEEEEGIQEEEHVEEELQAEYLPRTMNYNDNEKKKTAYKKEVEPSQFLKKDVETNVAAASQQPGQNVKEQNDWGDLEDDMLPM